MGNWFWFYFVLLGASIRAKGSVSLIPHLPPHPPHRTDCHTALRAAVGPRPQLVARAGSYIMLFVSSRLWDSNCLTVPARPRYWRETTGDNYIPLFTRGNYFISRMGLLPDRKSNYARSLGLKINAKNLLIIEVPR